MSDPRWTINEAVRLYEFLTADGDRTAYVLAEVARRLAAAAGLLAQAGEGCLTVCPARQRTAEQAWEAGPWIDVRSEADLIEDVLEDLGEMPDELDLALWQVELRQRARDDET